MPSFRDNLLTWLFFIAAACVGGVDFTRGRGEVTLAMLLSGFIYIAGAWGAVGKAHRLIRGAAVVVAPFAATLPFYLISPSSDEAGMILAATSIFTLASFGVSGITSLLIRSNSSSTSRNGGRWQISLSEILGWTIVVAIASFAVSKSVLPGDGPWAWVVIEAANVVPFAAMIALFLAPRPHRDRAAVIISSLLFGSWYVLVAIFFGDPYFLLVDSSAATAQVLCFVALWILCVRLDECAIAARKSESGKPTIKICDESSHEE